MIGEVRSATVTKSSELRNAVRNEIALSILAIQLKRRVTSNQSADVAMPSAGMEISYQIVNTLHVNALVNCSITICVATKQMLRSSITTFFVAGSA